MLPWIRSGSKLHARQNRSVLSLWHNILGVQLYFRRFYPKIWGVILKKWLPICDSKYCASLATTFFHLSDNCRILCQKTMYFLRRSTNRSIFWLLHKSGNADETGFNSYGTQFTSFWIIPIALRHFEMACWVTPNDFANSSCVWHESLASIASNSESSKIFYFPPPCRSSESKSPSWSVKTTHATFFY